MGGVSKTALGAAITILLLSSLLEHASAGGLVLPTRGVRPTARAGAFVAGADDLGAIYFNPAGLGAGGETSGTTFLFDTGYVGNRSSYHRIDSGLNDVGTVENEAPGLPIPTMAIGFHLNEKTTIAMGAYTYYLGLSKYPETGGQRYTLVDQSETKLGIVEIAAAHQISKHLRVGIGL